MAGLLILIGLILAGLVFQSGVIRLAAGMLRSPVATVRRSILVTFALVIAAIVLTVLESWVESHMARPKAAPAVPVGEPVHVFWVRIAFAVLGAGGAIGALRREFEVTIWRAGAIFGAIFALSLAWVAVVVFAVHPYIEEGYVVPTASSAPALLPDDHILVNKIRSPQIGDLVAYRTPEKQIHIHRLIAGPGDRVRFDSREIYINGRAEPYAPPVKVPDQFSFHQDFRYRPGEVLTLHDEEYFVVGDNLTRAFDSRYVGPIRRTDLVGVADLIYWPSTRVRLLK